jgi:iron complex outermembrane receptor protein
MRASAGYVDGEYDRVLFDISGDGVIDDTDLRLDLPRLAPWSYGAELIYEHELPFGEFQAQVSGYRRDPSAYTDSNAGQLRAIDRFDARIGLSVMNGALVFSAFGKNLKDESTIGGDTQLPFFPNATFSPLNKGRVYGFEVQYRRF